MHNEFMSSRSCLYLIAFAFLEKMDSGGRNTANILKVSTRPLWHHSVAGMPVNRIGIVPVTPMTLEKWFLSS